MERVDKIVQKMVSKGQLDPSFRKRPRLRLNNLIWWVRALKVKQSH